MGYRILVVDDSPVLRIMLQEMLTAMGHEIVGDAETGAGALKAFREKKPELVTLDVSLPDMNGIEVLRKMKQIDPSRSGAHGHRKRPKDSREAGGLAEGSWSSPQAF